MITGGASGIGRAIALEFATRGANIVVADVDESGAKSTVSEIESMGREALAVRADVGEMREVDGIITNALTVFGRIDILVNNAGVGGATEWWTREEAGEEDWDLAYAVNVRGMVHTIEAAQDHLRARQSGKIVNIVSLAGRRGPGSPLTHYAASKGAAMSVSQAFALRLAPFNINVNAVCPGPVWTPLAEAWFAAKAHRDPQVAGKSPRESFDEHVRATTALGRGATPEHVGKVAAFLASDRAKNVTGQAINVNGGAYFN